MPSCLRSTISEGGQSKCWGSKSDGSKGLDSSSVDSELNSWCVCFVWGTISSCVSWIVKRVDSYLGPSNLDDQLVLCISSWGELLIIRVLGIQLSLVDAFKGRANIACSVLSGCVCGTKWAFWIIVKGWVCPVSVTSTGILSKVTDIGGTIASDSRIWANIVAILTWLNPESCVLCVSNQNTL